MEIEDDFIDVGFLEEADFAQVLGVLLLEEFFAFFGGHEEEGGDDEEVGVEFEEGVAELEDLAHFLVSARGGGLGGGGGGEGVGFEEGVVGGGEDVVEEPEEADFQVLLFDIEPGR